MVATTINYKKGTLNATISNWILSEMDKLVMDKTFSSRSEFAEVACTILLERFQNRQPTKAEEVKA